MNSRNAEIFERSTQRIREGPSEPISLEQAAEREGLSPSRLHQIFAEEQGENFGAFIRRARVEYACGLMRAFKDWSCTRVAYEAGFSESSDFSRSFKRHFGIAPSSWDRVVPLCKQLPMLKNRQDAGDRIENSEKNQFTDGFEVGTSPVSVRPRPKEAIALIVVRDPFQPENMAQGFTSLESWLGTRSQIRPGRQFMGLSYDSTLDTPTELSRFELAYPVDPGTDGSDDVIIRELPEMTTAVLPCRGGVKEFVSAWDYLLRGFIPTGKWKKAEGPQLEIYYNDPRKHQMRYWDMDCVVPVKPKGESDD